VIYLNISCAPISPWRKKEIKKRKEWQKIETKKEMKGKQGKKPEKKGIKK